MATTEKYWERRFELLEQARHDRSRRSVDLIDQAFKKAQYQIKKEIEAWYGRLAKNNNITLTEARKLLNAKELEEFKWDVWEYIKRGEENSLDGRWMKELENASAKFHISRLEALRIRIQQAAEEAFQQEHDITAESIRETYTEDYLHTAYEIEKGTGIGIQIGEVSSDRINMLMSKPWTADNLTFSDRIWKNKVQFVDKLQSELLRCCSLGKNPAEAIEALLPFVDDTCKNARHAAGRLVMTEAAYIGTEAEKDCYKALGVEEYEFVATLDNRTSEICRSMDGMHFKLSEQKIGVNAPPMHCFCRSCTAPYIDDEWRSTGERIARDADGKAYYVPKDMTYREWEKKYAADAVNQNDKKQYDRIKAILGDNAPGSVDTFVNIKHNNIEEYEKLKLLSRGKSYFQEQFNYEVKGEDFFIPKDTIIQKVTVIAGKGTNTVLRDTPRLSQTYDKPEEEWMKKAGSFESDKYKFEVHWYEAQDGIQREMKLSLRTERK